MINANSEVEKGGAEVITVAEIEIQSIIPSLMRHIIKRYLKKVGLTNVTVIHKTGNTPFTLKLIIEAQAPKPLTKEMKSKINYLVSSLEYVLEKVNGKGSEADPEELRNMLAKVEPTLRKVYYKVK